MLAKCCCFFPLSDVNWHWWLCTVGAVESDLTGLCFIVGSAVSLLRWMELAGLVALSAAALSLSRGRRPATEVLERSRRIRNMPSSLEGYQPVNLQLVYTDLGSTVSLKASTWCRINISLYFSYHWVRSPSSSLSPSIAAHTSPSQCVWLDFLLIPPFFDFPLLFLCPSLSFPLSPCVLFLLFSLCAKRKLQALNIWCVWIAHKQLFCKEYSGESSDVSLLWSVSAAGSGQLRPAPQAI